jgi:hypothetical protein
MADRNDTRQNVVKLPIPAGPKPNVSALAREHGVSRQTMRRRLANGWQPPTAPSIEILSPPQRVATPGHPMASSSHRHGSYVAATILALAALTLGGIQLAIDGQYAGGFGRTPVETTLQAVQGVAIGLAAMILPSTAAVLRRAGHRSWSHLAWLIWPGFVMLTIIASMGFSAGGLSDTLAGRAASIEQAQSARGQAIAIAQRAVDTATEARKAECAPRGPRCRDREADERAALGALNAAIAATVPLAPSIASADPGGDATAANLTWLTRGYLHATAADIERAWIAGRAIVPALAGYCSRWRS